MSGSYPVIELFESIQGEGYFQGLGAGFIRLAGCNLRCSWCDTRQALTLEKAALMTIDEILRAGRFTQPRVIITGGEPTLHDLGPLVKALKSVGKYVCLETNGTNPVPAEWGIDWITASPKPDSNYVLRCRADELKYVVDSTFAAAVVSAGAVPAERIYLQIEGGKAESAAKAYQIVMENPHLQLRVGTQLHKMIHVE
ncbi:hypothetical protein P22_1304 [Propionispora sp. 2/2-37]|uniref:7-carboxy-7-deazaguanine synthase QueE n=1 Tax=Propionispora sp. 2/2-37 TaxID=1677858 RepID=UPI0006BB95DA|nr:7-carboxy-7-deazaguanine synthase QueE [Propionispora sp. 2/2-37]CUH95234.1 hypothetical protein P22_1304 [Propionispora sp. 2/2-37]